MVRQALRNDADRPPQLVRGNKQRSRGLGALKKSITALVLCGGKGERLRPLTDVLPKPLVRLRGRPILSYVIGHLRKYEIEDVVIAAGYQKERIFDFFEENHHGVNVRIVDSGDVDIIERIKDCSS
jgi:NDP-sugar pyrophosphorylase family protein